MRIRQSLMLIGPILVGLTALGATSALATTVQATNLAELLGQADAILAGTVTEVTDGVDADTGLPYTQVSMEVTESIRGGATGTFKFQQYGLLQPRPMPGTSLLLMGAIDGMPRFEAGEQVVLFLGPTASLTGLRTTVGLGQGKFTIRANGVMNGENNQGVFDNLAIEPNLLTPKDRRMVATAQGTVDTATFMGFVRRAVTEKWVESGRLGTVVPKVRGKKSSAQVTNKKGVANAR